MVALFAASVAGQQGVSLLLGLYMGVVASHVNPLIHINYHFVACNFI